MPKKIQHYPSREASFILQIAPSFIEKALIHAFQALHPRTVEVKEKIEGSSVIGREKKRGTFTRVLSLVQRSGSFQHFLCTFVLFVVENGNLKTQAKK